MSTVTGGMNLIGVNIAGGEFGSNVPGVLGTDYIYPSMQEIDYYAAQGMTVIRVPFLIERLENSPGGPFSQQDLQQLQSIVAHAATKGVDVILDPHNYGDAWGQEILPGNTTGQEYDKFMSQLAMAFKSDPNVIFGLMNQPNQQTPTQQAQIDNRAIAAIRTAGATQELLVPGTDWDGGWTWVSSGNAAAINPRTIIDPDHNYAIEVHQYLDSDGSGTNFSPITDPNIGPERLTAVTQWAEQNGVKLFLGETGVPSDSQSLTALQNELSYMEQNSSVWQGLAYWAGGAWWGSYPMSIEPTGLGTGIVTNAPQMNVLNKFAPTSPGGGTTGSTYPAITNGSGPDSIILQMSENAWANGDDISDANGDAEFTVSVNGVQQGGTFTALAPHATSDGATVSNNPGEQTFTFNGTFGVNPTLTVDFINDAYGGTPQTDRNLYVDSISYDGVNQNQSEALYSDGTVSFALDPPGTGTESSNYIQFIGGSMPGTHVIYDTATAAPAPAASAVPIEYDIGADMAGTVSISDFREGVDSLALASGISVVSKDFTNSGGLMLNLSNQGHVLVAVLS